MNDVMTATVRGGRAHAGGQLGAGLVGGGIIAGADAARDGRGDLTVIAIFTGSPSWRTGAVIEILAPSRLCPPM